MAETKVKKTAAVSKKPSKSKKPVEAAEASSKSSGAAERKLKKLKKVKKVSKPSETAAAAAEQARTPRTPKVPIDVSRFFDRHLLTPTDLDPLTVSQLKTLCRNRKVVGYSGKRKGDIMQLLTTLPAESVTVS